MEGQDSAVACLQLQQRARLSAPRAAGKGCILHEEGVGREKAQKTALLKLSDLPCLSMCLSLRLGLRFASLYHLFLPVELKSIA